MHSSPKLVGYAAFSGLQSAADKLITSAQDTDFEDRLRIHLAAYCLGTAIATDFVTRNHSWPAEDFFDEFTTGIVNSPGFFEGQASLNDTVVFAPECAAIESELEKYADSGDRAALLSNARDSENLFYVLCAVRNRTYSETLRKARLEESDEAIAHIKTGLFCISSWIWGSAPTNEETQKTGMAFFKDISNWMFSHILPVLEQEDDE